MRSSERDGLTGVYIVTRMGGEGAKIFHRFRYLPKKRNFWGGVISFHENIHPWMVGLEDGRI